MKSFWANKTVFQMMMLSYNLFLLFRFDFLRVSEFRQQIKTFQLKFVFLAVKIISSTRYVVMKLPEKYIKTCIKKPGIIIDLKYPKPLFLFNWMGENVSKHSVLRNC